MLTHLNIIKKQNNILSLKYKDKPYIIGFQNGVHAKYVSCVMTKPPHLNLKRRHTLDIHKEINDGLMDLGISPIHTSDVTVDVEAELSISKIYDITASSKDDSMDDVVVERIEYADFLMYPFEKYLGVVIPFAILEENDAEIIFQSQVIDPCEEFKIFRKLLEP